MDSFIVGPSAKNQRIERMWRDVPFTFYYTFYSRGDGQLFTIATISICLLDLHLSFQVRINQALKEFKEFYNNHQVPAKSNWTPN